MISFEEAGAILDEACEALPEGIFDGLNGGVSLLPDTVLDEDGRYTLGMYHDDMMGCWIEIFYGSVLEAAEDDTDEAVARALVETLHHELRHHVEGLAGDRSLEMEDEAETEEYRRDMETTRFDQPRKSLGRFGRLRRRNKPVLPFEEEEAP